MAAAVQIGNRRFAWRTSSEDVATVQVIVAAMVPAAITVSQATGTMSGIAARSTNSARSSTPTTTSVIPNKPRLRDAPERRPERDRDHQRDRPERDVQPRQRVRRQPAQDQRVDADLADAPPHLERREHQRDEPDDRDLVVAHVRRATQSRAIDPGRRPEAIVGGYRTARRGNSQWQRSPRGLGRDRERRPCSTNSGQMGDTRREAHDGPRTRPTAKERSWPR